MPDVIGGIDCFRHGTDSESLDERLGRFALAVIQEGIDMFVRGLAIAGEFKIEAKALDELAEFANLLGVWIVVYTIDEWFGIRRVGGILVLTLLLTDFCGDNTIGKKHKLLNQVVGIQRIVEENIYRFVIFV